MYLISFLLIKIILACVSTNTTALLHPDTGLNIIELVTKYGYPLENHQVQTEDGYVLTVFRIPYGNRKNNNISLSSNDTKPVALLMHGWLSSAMDWVNKGPNASLAFLLADAGYDVWLGNQRGNTWSRKHIHLDPDADKKEFFNFSFHEIGIYDLPAKIDYILNKTNQSNLFYIGYSQGTTTFFVMASEKPAYNNKIRFMTALAPVAYTGDLKNFYLKFAAQHYATFTIITDILNMYEVLPYSNAILKFGKIFCSNDSLFQSICVNLIFSFFGFDRDQLDPFFLTVIMSNAPAGSSVYQIRHFLQEIISERFSNYNYGPLKNLAVYGTIMPPDYKVEKITAPVAFYHGGNDWLAVESDVQRLADRLPNLVRKQLIPEFNHLDFYWANDVVALLYDNVIEELNILN